MDKIKELIFYFLDLDTLFYKIGSIILIAMVLRYLWNKDHEYILMTMGLGLIFIDLGW